MAMTGMILRMNFTHFWYGDVQLRHAEVLFQLDA